MMGSVSLKGDKGGAPEPVLSFSMLVSSHDPSTASDHRGHGRVCGRQAVMRHFWGYFTGSRRRSIPRGTTRSKLS